MALNQSKHPKLSCILSSYVFRNGLHASNLRTNREQFSLEKGKIKNSQHEPQCYWFLLMEKSVTRENQKRRSDKAVNCPQAIKDVSCPCASGKLLHRRLKIDFATASASALFVICS